MPRQRTKAAVEDIKASTTTESKKNPKRNASLLIPTGSTLFNLALSDDPFGGWASGGMANLIGDSSAGKTVLSLTMLAELCRNTQFDDYVLIYDDCEHRNNFDLATLYGDAFVERVQAPGGWVDGMPVNSTEMGQFQDHVHEHIDSGVPFVYVLDSFDSLTTQADIDQYESERKARRAGKDVSGSYGMYKAKAASETFRHITSALSKTQSFLLIVSQTRDNIGPGFAEKTRSGGKALKFYSDHEVWLAHMEHLKKTATGEELPIGIRSRAKIKKNSITGKIRQADFEIYYDYGVDDISQNIDFLVRKKRWQKKKQTICADEFDVEMTKVKLIEHIEDKNLERRLAQIVAKEWRKREAAVKRDRKSKY